MSIRSDVRERINAHMNVREIIDLFDETCIAADLAQERADKAESALLASQEEAERLRGELEDTRLAMRAAINTAARALGNAQAREQAAEAALSLPQQVRGE